MSPAPTVEHSLTHSPPYLSRRTAVSICESPVLAACGILSGKNATSDTQYLKPTNFEKSSWYLVELERDLDFLRAVAMNARELEKPGLHG